MKSESKCLTVACDRLLLTFHYQLPKRVQAKDTEKVERLVSPCQIRILVYRSLQSLNVCILSEIGRTDMTHPRHLFFILQHITK